jgi:hypothetical protein
MARHQALTHGPRRRWIKPWRQICRCGSSRYPCAALRQLEGPQRQSEAPQEVPLWAGSTQELPFISTVARLPNVVPLMTPAQRYRSRQIWDR